jgi:hypothetical protein
MLENETTAMTNVTIGEKSVAAICPGPPTTKKPCDPEGELSPTDSRNEGTTSFRGYRAPAEACIF